MLDHARVSNCCFFAIVSTTTDARLKFLPGKLFLHLEKLEVGGVGTKMVRVKNERNREREV